MAFLGQKVNMSIILERMRQKGKEFSLIWKKATSWLQIHALFAKSDFDMGQVHNEV